ncbi:MAG TPA: radical SAM protein [Pirellulales bacterium]|nr:radical SAM protein [Pirellulales bacterium]
MQLPIPPVGPGPIRGNVPLAAGYLKMYAQCRGLNAIYEIDILPTPLANTLGDQGLVSAILAAEPWMVGFTCYLWNIERTLWIAAELKRARADLKIILGGPEVTADNKWVLAHPAVDYAAIGEGEQTFAELLESLERADRPLQPIAGLHVQGGSHPEFRRPLPKLDEISSPYLAGILDAADEQMLLLETIRGCIFKCKFCYYPKSYDDLYFVSEDRIVANLEHAQRRGAKEVVLLDPTLNQRRDFGGFLKLLARCNPDRQFTYFGELRAEGINAEIARLLREANFAEVEIGLQSIDPLAMELMDRNNNLRAFERGARAMLDEGIKVKVDLIIGLPGDTVDSIRRGIDYVHRSGLYSLVQVFNLAILPGTAFRQEARQLGLVFQNRPPYYVLETPTLRLEQMVELMEEAQETFETEFDPLPPPVIPDFGMECTFDLDRPLAERLDHLPLAAGRPQAFTLWLRSADFDRQRHNAVSLVARLLDDNPYTTLQILVEPLGDPRRLTSRTLELLRATCYRQPTYLDKFYSVLPGRPKGAKRLVVLLASEGRETADVDWLDGVEEYATVVCRDGSLAHQIV